MIQCRSLSPLDQVTNSAELAARGELFETGLSSLGVEQVDPGRDRSDPLAVLCKLEQVVGVGVVARALHQDDCIDAGRLEERLELFRPERSRDRGDVGRDPGLRVAVEVPEVDVCIDDHGARCLASGFDPFAWSADLQMYVDASRPVRFA